MDEKWISDEDTYTINPQAAEQLRDDTTDGVVFKVLRCPSCDSADVTVRSTVKPIRYNTCRNCGNRFKAIWE